ncbi:hypothetical protein A9P82_03560 [Arachidicoccus ginsenosidimutans]|uniref:hypothetical protein n=1 Tax=Arachidicoccus sp. BS20 TaxID=1850526 RepID=UPI0007F09AE9|nr:hypothetical protein [Arachidicoccus sp. BS20]ANI88459.1 hypothetical protein A9P82_03560 [Arachidicoccus sp. BS20]
MSNSYSSNPFLKKGDYIYLHSTTGRNKIISVEENGFYSVPEESANKNVTPEFHHWNDFRRWSRKRNEEQH